MPMWLFLSHTQIPTTTICARRVPVFGSVYDNTLGGELTSRLVLKVLTVGAIAGTAFSYYLSDLRREERE
jgi:hypothetical protein